MPVAHAGKLARERQDAELFVITAAVRMIAARTSAKGGIDLIGSGKVVDSASEIAIPAGQPVKRFRTNKALI